MNWKYFFFWFRLERRRYDETIQSLAILSKHKFVKRKQHLLAKTCDAMESHLVLQVLECSSIHRAYSIHFVIFLSFHHIHTHTAKQTQFAVKQSKAKQTTGNSAQIQCTTIYVRTYDNITVWLSAPRFRYIETPHYGCRIERNRARTTSALYRTNSVQLFSLRASTSTVRWNCVFIYILCPAYYIS